MCSKITEIHEQYSTIKETRKRGNISPRFSSYSEATASELLIKLLELLEKILEKYIMRSLASSKFHLHTRVSPVARGFVNNIMCKC